VPRTPPAVASRRNLRIELPSSTPFSFGTPADVLRFPHRVDRSVWLASPATTSGSASSTVVPFDEEDESPFVGLLQVEAT
jgi:hypothetical protein